MTAAHCLWDIRYSRFYNTLDMWVSTGEILMWVSNRRALSLNLFPQRVSKKTEKSSEKSPSFVYINAWAKRISESVFNDAIRLPLTLVTLNMYNQKLAFLNRRSRYVVRFQTTENHAQAMRVLLDYDINTL